MFMCFLAVWLPPDSGLELISFSKTGPSHCRDSSVCSDSCMKAETQCENRKETNRHEIPSDDVPEQGEYGL